MKTFLITFALVATAGSGYSQSRFSAADAQGVRLRTHGKVVIANTSRALTVYRVEGEIERALFQIQATHSLSTQPFGDVVYASNSPLPVNVATQYANVFRDAASEAGIDPRLLLAVAFRESALNPNAVSPRGAVGMMQLMPATARYLGVNDPLSPEENVRAGAHYLKKLLSAFNGDLDLALAAYNAGPENVRRFNGVPPFGETQSYVRFIREHYRKLIGS
jgi:soluble lytic murein transglycosylase-like protein